MRTPDIYKDLNIKSVINGKSWFTNLGGSIMKPEVIDAMNQASNAFINYEELHEKCSDQVAKLCQAESALITSGCASAIVLMSASVLCKKDMTLIDKIPNQTENFEILISKHHRNHYDPSFEATGAKLIDFNDYKDLDEKINSKTVAIAFVEATFLENKIDFNQIISIADKNNIPVIVDASAKLPPLENLYKFTKGGAALVSFSGGKGVRGPQNTGFMIGKKEYINFARKNLICFSDKKAKIGRPMKVSKECIIGLTTALKIFLDTDQDTVWREWKNKAKYIINGLGNIDGIKIALEDESTVREGPQVIFYFSSEWKGIAPEELKRKLESGDPGIYLGDGGYGADMNISMVNIRDGEEKIITEKLKQLLVI
tara:strand:- start:597 stop:1709 length:1113 start_codon:yes stop_codon:yes gene_type:complete